METKITPSKKKQLHGALKHHYDCIMTEGQQDLTQGGTMKPQTSTLQGKRGKLRDDMMINTSTSPSHKRTKHRFLRRICSRDYSISTSRKEKEYLSERSYARDSSASASRKGTTRLLMGEAINVNAISFIPVYAEEEH